MVVSPLQITMRRKIYWYKYLQGRQIMDPFADGSNTPRSFTAQTWYYYPAGAAPQNGPIFIGPLSTLVFAQQQAVPGLGLDDATNIVAANLGLTPEQVTSNYLEGNTPDDDQAQFTAEIVGASISGTANTDTSYGDDIQIVLNDVENVRDTASSNSASSFDTNTYTPQGANSSNTRISPLYTPVADVCSDLLNGKYFAFEEWPGDKEHKTLYMITDSNTGNNILHLKEELENGSAWSIDTLSSSTELAYLAQSEGTIIDMTNVNSSSSPYAQITHDGPFPAINTSCNGSNATFDSQGRIFTLVVSEADIAGVDGADLPQGPTVDPILNGVTFGVGDKIYKAIVVTQNQVYGVDNSISVDNSGNIFPANPTDYIVYDEGASIGGSPFQPMPNSNDINTMAQFTDTDFVIDYRDSSNFTKLSVTSPAASNNTGTVDVVEVDTGVEGSPVTMTYEVEMHNSTPFFFIKNYPESGIDTFIGKIDAISSTDFVYGLRSRPAGQSFYLTQGGGQDGDMMDDIMLNASARDRVLSGQGLTYP